MGESNERTLLEASWIIALYKAIHGGDPGPEKTALSQADAVSIAARAVEALVGYVAAAAVADPVVISRDARRHFATAVKAAGFEVVEDADKSGPVPTKICYRLGGTRMICIQFPPGGNVHT
jgi:hypothetical protein